MVVNTPAVDDTVTVASTLGTAEPGARPIQWTVAFWGALYLSAVCVLPTILINNFGVPFYFGGTGLLIVVGVSIDTVSQIETHLITRHYEGLAGGRRMRGRN